MGADDVDWVFGDVEELPFADGAFDVVISAYGATLSPSPRRTVRELLRVLAPGGVVVMTAAAPRSLLGVAFDLAQEGPGALPRGLPSPVAWGRRDIAEERIEAVAPDTWVEVLRHTLRLEFASLDEAWDAFSGPFGLAELSRGEFAGAVAMRSETHERVVFDEPVMVIRARRPG
jgi:SAM-dependent methyltransferase